MNWLLLFLLLVFFSNGNIIRRGDDYEFSGDIKVDGKLQIGNVGNVEQVLSLLSQQLDEQNNTNSLLNEELCDLRSIVVSQSEELKQQNNTNLSQNEELCDLRSIVVSQSEELKQQNRTIQSKGKEIKELNASVCVLEEKLKKQNHTTENQGEKIVELQNENVVQEGLLEEQNRTIALQEQEIKDVKGKDVDMQRQLREQNETIEIHGEDIMELKKENTVQKVTIREQNRTVQLQQEELIRINGSVSKVESEIDVIENDVSVLYEEIVCVRVSLGDMNVTITGQQEEMYGIEDNVSELMDEKETSSVNVSVSDGPCLRKGDVVLYDDEKAVPMPFMLNSQYGWGYGSESVFNMGTVSHMSSFVLTNTKFVITYGDGGNSGYGTLIIGTTGNPNITFSEKFVFNAANTGYISSFALNEEKFVITYRDNFAPYYGKSIVGTLTGSIVTFGSEFVFNAETTAHMSSFALSEEKFVVTFRDHFDGKYHGTAIVGIINGANIDFGTKFMFNTEATARMSSFALSEEKFVVTFGDKFDKTYHGTATVGSLNGTSVSFGTKFMFNTAPTAYISSFAVSEEKFVVTYGDYIDGKYNGKLKVGYVSGQIVTFGLEYTFSAATTAYLSSFSLSETKFVVSYRDYSVPYYGKSIIGMISGDYITFSSVHVFNPEQTAARISSCRISETSFVVNYGDLVDGSWYGVSVIGTFSGTIAVAREDGCPGDYVEIVIFGLCPDCFSDLLPSYPMILSSNGTLVPLGNKYDDAQMNNYVGLALSRTTLFVNFPLRGT